MSAPTDARARFFSLLRAAVDSGAWSKLTLGKYRGADATLRNVFVRPVTLKSGPHLTFVWRYETRDVTKNLPPAEAIAQIDALIGRDFLDAHLFTATENAQFETQPDGSARLRVKKVSTSSAAAPAASHNRAKNHLIDPLSSWLRALGVTNDRGHASEGMADKLRQIQKFAELLTHLLADLPAQTEPLAIADMGSGKGYLTFAVAALLRERARVVGIEARHELVELCNRIASEHGLAEVLRFETGTIAEATLTKIDVLIALHACDTATDDAIARGIAADAKLIVVSPCCQKELRAQLTAPPVLADALRHGIFQERQAEFVTDAMRAQLLEWAGYRTKVFEFISTEHTAKNLMIAAVKAHAPGEAARAARLREFAAFYGIREQRLASHLHFPLAAQSS
ncbi:MAG: SAM-dependent methyltransferase [Opitutus sp.]|nr:SAM-dependent methyltransferase [Opitutus sp.]